jgi:tetratricopeptide (TPR) repeat protein
LYGPHWGAQGRVAESFGAAYAEIGEMDDAIRWYERAASAEDGAVSLRAHEQLGNLRARRGERMKNPVEGRREIEAAIQILLRVVSINSNGERESLLGSAFKRLTMVEQRLGRRAEARRAIKEMAMHYRKAEDLLRKNDPDNLYYPAMNRMSAELVLNSGKKDWAGFDSTDLAAVRQSLQKKVMLDPDFWSVVGLTELRIYEALAQRQLAKSLAGILAELVDLKTRVGSTQMWDSVHAQARFTLQPYIDSSQSSQERDAARKLLSKLKEFAAA